MTNFPPLTQFPANARKKTVLKGKMRKGKYKGSRKLESFSDSSRSWKGAKGTI